jgi:phage-related protein
MKKFIDYEKFIAYKGKVFTIEWYFDIRGRSIAREYFEGLANTEQAKALTLFKTMGDFGKIWNEQKFRNEGDQIYAFKPMPHRFLSFFCTGSKIIVTNAFQKKTEKLPPGEKAKALKCYEDYKERFKKGTYYDEQKEKNHD